MVRWALLSIGLCLSSLSAQQQQPQPPPKGGLKTQRPTAPTTGKEEIPPEEDTSLTTTNYSFNPLQSTKDVGVGNLYFKNHKYRAAEMRYTSATKWNDANGEAWLRLGEVEEKLKDKKAAVDAYHKYLEIASDAKNAADIRKRIEKLK